MKISYLTLKVCTLLITLIIICTINFAIPRLMPGDPLLMTLGQDAAQLTGADFAALAKKHGLDRPLAEQYLAYLQGIATSDLGYSYHYRQPVSSLITRHLGWTLAMLLPALVLSAFLALLLGLSASWNPGSQTDNFITCSSLVFFSLPQFLIGMLLLKLLGFELKLFPLGGLASGTAQSVFSQALDVAWHLLLPIVTLTISATAAKLLVLRNSAVSQRHQAYIAYATAKGLSAYRIITVHLLRNACLPLLSLLALNLGFIVSGALIVEIVFSIDGMGSLIYQAALYRDYPLLQGCFLVLTLFVIVCNALADLAYGIIDPRISH